MRLRQLLLIFCALYAASAQLPMIGFSGGGGGTRDGGFQGTATFSLQRRTLPAVLHAPFYGEPKNETSRTLPDGTHINRVAPDRGIKVWRDSQGRVRIEQSFSALRRANVPTLVEIDDPAAGQIYILDSATKTAHRVKVAVMPERDLEKIAAARGMVVGVGPLPARSEDLGAQIIDGVTVHGTRTTRVDQPGAAGNDAPIAVTTETWFSTELDLAIRTIINDPRSGTQTNSVVNLSRAEPDSSLFLPPVEYTVVDESGEFTLRWGGK